MAELKTPPWLLCAQPMVWAPMPSMQSSGKPAGLSRVLASFPRSCRLQVQHHSWARSARPLQQQSASAIAVRLAQRQIRTVRLPRPSLPPERRPPTILFPECSVMQELSRNTDAPQRLRYRPLQAPRRRWRKVWRFASQLKSREDFSTMLAAFWLAQPVSRLAESRVRTELPHSCPRQMEASAFRAAFLLQKVSRLVAYER